MTGFAGRGFRVSGTVYTGGVLLTPEWAEPWPAPAATIDALAPLLAIAPTPEFVILGTGAVMQFPDPALVAALEARGIGIETMDSRAAARAWGVLRGEDRWIAAALMPL